MLRREIMTMTTALNRGLVERSPNLENVTGIWVLYDYRTKNSIYWGSKEVAQLLLGVCRK